MDTRFRRKTTSYGRECEIPDLNRLRIPADTGDPRQLEDCGCSSGQVEVVFRNLADRLVQLIYDAEIVVGCVAWLTNPSILDALAAKQGVSLIVQKEDFLRPDAGAVNGWKRSLREKYGKLSPLSRHLFGTILGSMSYLSDFRLDPVRCLGNFNRDRVPAFPRCHHKFVVFCDFEPGKYRTTLRPQSVWTGSFNFTQNSTCSLENGLHITDAKIAQAFFEEYSQLAAISEPLDWSSDWCEPEWRIGT